MTGVLTERVRLEALRSSPRSPTGVETESAAHAAARRVAEAPPEGRLPRYVVTSLRGYRRLWAEPIDPRRAYCPVCGRPEDMGTHRIPNHDGSRTCSIPPRGTP